MQALRPSRGPLNSPGHCCPPITVLFQEVHKTPVAPFQMWPLLMYLLPFVKSRRKKEREKI